MPGLLPGDCVSDLVQHRIPAFLLRIDEGKGSRYGDQPGVEPTAAETSSGPVELKPPALLMQAELLQFLIGERGEVLEMQGWHWYVRDVRRVVLYAHWSAQAITCPEGIPSEKFVGSHWAPSFLLHLDELNCTLTAGYDEAFIRL